MSCVKKTLSAVAAAGLTLTLTACGGSSSPEVTPAPPAAAETEASTPSPTPSVEVVPTPEAPAAERGTRENPLAPGEARKISDSSAWTISAAPTEARDGYVVLPLTVGIDWASVRKQQVEAGEAEGGPTNPVFSLSISFVSASGQTFTEYPISGQVENDWWQLGEVFEPLESITGNVAVTVPADQVAGGVWSIANTGGDRVFIAQQ